MSNIAKSFDISTVSLSVLHNYFDGPTKSFSDLHLAKFLDTLVKSIFLWIIFFPEITIQVDVSFKQGDRSQKAGAHDCRRHYYRWYMRIPCESLRGWKIKLPSSWHRRRFRCCRCYRWRDMKEIDRAFIVVCW